MTVFAIHGLIHSLSRFFVRRGLRVLDNHRAPSLIKYKVFYLQALMERNSKRQRDENTFDFIHLVAYLINSVVINEVFISFVTTLED